MIAWLALLAGLSLAPSSALAGLLEFAPPAVPLQNSINALERHDDWGRTPVVCPFSAPAGSGASPRAAAFYAKQVENAAVPVQGSAKVSDLALREADCLVRRMLSARPDVMKTLRDGPTRITIVASSEPIDAIPEYNAYNKKFRHENDHFNKRGRGYGATQELPISSGSEENLLCTGDARYSKESIFIHEFAHTIHVMALSQAMKHEIHLAYVDAMKNGLWENTYAATDELEYFANASQAWFDTARPGTHGPGRPGRTHNDVWTRASIKSYDPGISQILNAVYGDTPWRYSCPKPGETSCPK